MELWIITGTGSSIRLKRWEVQEFHRSTEAASFPGESIYFFGHRLAEAALSYLPEGDPMEYAAA